ncbi:chorismate-binding protein [Luteolibacter pohnpeiensis]|uniref:Chorismate-binding protein n=1 Tax=Luteolibacter pohnpeiensis TaxID=454153 RepID=A0A934VWH7_9BACT|nr:chorismate-binding protein [Luteolibacter pohnpeiensis]MBK1883295.1 chorismate-binding protein [Luteolibacter pohnpeiensis]
MNLPPESMAWLARSDGSVVVGEGPFVSAAEPPESGVAFLVHDYGLTSSTPWKIPSSYREIRTEKFAAEFGDAEMPEIHWRSPDPGPFSRVFQEIMYAIHEEEFEKTVPVVVETGEAEQPVGAGVIAAMARQQTPLCSYGWVQENGGFAGATPELLFSLQGKHLQTMALAGTARSEDREVFAVDEKEIMEHEYVAKTLETKLLGLGAMCRKPREILNLGSLVHFLTLISVELAAPLSVDELVERFHPTPALGPLPRTDRTLAMLKNWRSQLHCPSHFGSPFGVWKDGRFDAVVTIRGIWWHENQVHIPAGCGIIKASRLVNEWRELRLKRESVKRFMEQSIISDTLAVKKY